MSHVYAGKIGKIRVFKNAVPLSRRYKHQLFINNDFTKNLIKEDYQNDHEFLSLNKLK